MQRIEQLFQVTVFRNEDGNYIVIHNGRSFEYETEAEVFSALSTIVSARFEW